MIDRKNRVARPPPTTSDPPPLPLSKLSIEDLPTAVLTEPPRSPALVSSPRSLTRRVLLRTGSSSADPAPRHSRSAPLSPSDSPFVQRPDAKAPPPAPFTGLLPSTPPRPRAWTVSSNTPPRWDGGELSSPQFGRSAASSISLGSLPRDSLGAASSLPEPNGGLIRDAIDDDDAWQARYALVEGNAGDDGGRGRGKAVNESARRETSGMLGIESSKGLARSTPMLAIGKAVSVLLFSALEGSLLSGASLDSSWF
ncbi:hypothetical protein BDK51DRAFT_43104 [Blyttiomyces helicus]|uniref:Uncharacterized protein n=1 Tax=Blyttiomyces helicus TaxID=388810 RepID=A0A4P9VWA6_9FUNG|nr:hypothetical protein BDK51DRAFT_43104 [Blyttiomyces helicus]|eukprot:RKO83971.1 hypothetical protein BDK51DRAFT_43104 [Blyttiomyces helicus]